MSVRALGNSVGSMTDAPAAGRAIFLNGGSSSGKSTIGRVLQSTLDDVWLLIGIDVLIWLLPVELTEGPSGFSVVDGEIRRGSAFQKVYDGFRHSVAALCRAGQDVIIDDVLIDGGTDQGQWEIALTGIGTTWIGVRCDREVAIARESERGDRPMGIAGRYAERVHQGVHYDIEVNTSAASLEDTLDVVVRVLQERCGIAPRAQRRARDSLPPRSALSPHGSRSLAPWER
jgi:chloramphenicol 3-O phosphotransferase